MEKRSAGSTEESGGIVVGNSSRSVVNGTTGLYLHNEAQQGANGLNIVNSAGSAVANTVNVWTGDTVTLTVEDNNIKPVLEVNQFNQVTQQQPVSATLSGFSRPDAELTEIVKHAGSDSYINKIVNSHIATDLFFEEINSTTVSSGNVNTRTEFTLGDNLSFEGNLGQGVAVAGSAVIDFDGGSADIALVVGGGISVGADTADITGAITLPGFDLGTSGVAAGIDVEAGISVLVELELPKMNIELSGAGCGVVMGSCNASSIFEETKLTMTDNSSLDIVENHQSGQSAFSEESVKIIRSSFGLEGATAAYIVVDDSSLELYSNITLELSDSAQKDVEGMNIVNAIGSNVANATNVSRAVKFESNRSTLILNQFNVVHHGH